MTIGRKTRSQFSFHEHQSQPESLEKKARRAERRVDVGNDVKTDLSKREVEERRRDVRAYREVRGKFIGCAEHKAIFPVED